MSEKWELGIEVLGSMDDRLQGEHVSDYSDDEITAADYVLANAIEAEPCPPGVRAVLGYQAYCVLCGKGPPPEAEYGFWTSIDGALSELDCDGYQTLQDGRRVCNGADRRCWKRCMCPKCEGLNKIIGADQDTCHDAAGPAAND